MEQKTEVELTKTELERKIFSKKEFLLIDKEELEKRVEEGIAKKGRITASAEDVKRFLRLAAEGHRSYFKYTRLSRLRSLLKSRYEVDLWR